MNVRTEESSRPYALSGEPQEKPKTQVLDTEPGAPSVPRGIEIIGDAATQR